MSAPTPIELVHQLHEAVYGYTVARPESPERVWEELLSQVRRLASGWCGECVRRSRENLAVSVPLPEKGETR